MTNQSSLWLPGKTRKPSSGGVWGDPDSLLTFKANSLQGKTLISVAARTITWAFV